MDEPTNHLDLDSSEALIEALSDYAGTLIFVSHNRSFLDALATTIWDVRERTVVPYPGTLTEYQQRLESESSSREAAEESPGAEGAAGRPDKQRRREEAEARQSRAQRAGPLKKEVATLERRIAELETSQKAREAQLVDPEFIKDFSASRPVMDAHREAAAELEGLYARWEAASSALAAL
jgi:ATP-binding cassette subfamily F protein 3